VGDVIFLKDGTVRAKVTKKSAQSVTVKFLDAITLSSAVGVNIPKPITLTPLLSAKDKKVLLFAKKHDIEYIALSFTKTADDIREVKKALKDASIRLIAKIESMQGGVHADDILTKADGIMVARGDLGIEIPQAQVPVIQKQLIHLANQHGKIVITATEMLQSMVSARRPTRAETSDVANAILDGTDAIMLSQESAIGKHPVLAVQAMSDIARETEPSVRGHVERYTDEVSDLITDALNHFCSSIELDKIITVTRSGFTARMIARFRNYEPIIAVTRHEKVKRQLELVYGVHPVHFRGLSQTDQVRSCVNHLVKQKLLKKSDTVVFTAGTLAKEQGTNTLTIVRIKDIS
jgi:pyruvate kinase